MSFLHSSKNQIHYVCAHTLTHSSSVILSLQDLDPVAPEGNEGEVVNRIVCQVPVRHGDDEVRELNLYFSPSMNY